MEARRSRLERMQTLPNIKLINATSAHRTVLDATPEVPSDDDAAAAAGTQQQRRRPGKTTSLVKRVSEGRFFQTADRFPQWGRPASPVLRQSPLVSDAALQAQQVPAAGASSSMEQTASDETRQRQQPDDVGVEPDRTSKEEGSVQGDAGARLADEAPHSSTTDNDHSASVLLASVTDC